jgi:hypothetical protein
MPKPAGEDHRRRSPGVLHERGKLDAGTDGETVPVIGLLRGEDGDHEGYAL